MITKLIEIVYSFLWGDLIQIPLPGGSSVGISLLIILLIPMGIYFTVRTRFLPIRLFPDMVRALVGTKAKKDADGKSEKKEKKEKEMLFHISRFWYLSLIKLGGFNINTKVVKMFEICKKGNTEW